VGVAGSGREKDSTVKESRSALRRRPTAWAAVRRMVPRRFDARHADAISKIHSSTGTIYMHSRGECAPSPCDLSFRLFSGYSYGSVLQPFLTSYPNRTLTFGRYAPPQSCRNNIFHGNAHLFQLHAQLKGNKLRTIFINFNATVVNN